MNNAESGNPVLSWRAGYRRKMALLQRMLEIAGLAGLPAAIICICLGFLSWLWLIPAVALAAFATWFGAAWRRSFRRAFWRRFPPPGFEDLWKNAG